MYSIEQRKQKILRAVIIEYITDAEPVSSELLNKKYDFGVSSATIRNELAEMECMGLLEQVHTSSGRIPKDRGYRYFVDYLAKPIKISAQKKQKIQQTNKDGEILHLLLDQSVKILSKMTKLLSAATIFPNPEIQVRHFNLSLITEHSTLLVLVLSNGHVENKLIHFQCAINSDTVQRLNHYLLDTIQNKNLIEIQKIELINVPCLLVKYSEELFKSLRQTLQEILTTFITIEGEEFLFIQPETTKNQTYVSDLITSLSHPHLLTQALNHPSTETSKISTKVSIGTENFSKYLFPFTLMKTDFYVGDTPTGALALIGPTRLNYEFCLPILEFAAQTLTQNLKNYFLS